jgi:thiamine-phosphate pyrophosphorylase
MDDGPRIYLITPPEFELSWPGEVLAPVLDAHDVACVRLALSSRDEDRISRAADALREVAHARDIPVVLAEHVELSQRLGLDGVHLTDGSRSVRKVRKTLGGEAIVGAFCGASRHEGMSAGEGGADYVAFGPVGGGALGDGTKAEADLFEWWSQMIEVPVVAEGALSAGDVNAIGAFADFLAVGEEIWRGDDPAGALAAILGA